MITRRTFLAASCALAASRAFGVEPATTQKAAMIKRKIPRDGREIPVIGLGTWNALNPEKVNEETLAPRAEVLKRFYEAGGRLVDTAPSYGTAEDVVGILTQRLKLSNELFIATKVLERNEANGEKSFKRSLERLKRDHIDLMQVHNYIDWPTQLKSMRKWKEAGTFRYIGVTHYQDVGHEELEQILKRDKPDFLQVNYSLSEPNAAKRLLPTAQDNGVAVLINRPFAAGGQLRKLKDKPLPDFVKQYATSWAQVSLKFVVSHPAVTCALPATGNPEHLRDNVQAGFGDLPDEKDRERWLKEFAA